MKLQKLSIRNFGSFGNTPQVIDLSHLGLTLLVGNNEDDFQSNGAGKSTFLEAIVFALYGKRANKSKASDLVNRKVGKDLQVKLTFTKGKNSYRIERYRKDSKYHNKALVFLNGKDITPRSIQKTNDLMQQIIGIDMNTYLHSYMFGLGNNTDFISATDAQKKKILEDMADLSIYPVAYEIAKEEVKELKNNVTLYKSKVEATKEILKSLNGLQNDMFKSAKERKNRLSIITHKLITSKKTLAKIKDSNIQNKIVKIENVIKSLTPKLSIHDKIAKAINKLQDQITRSNMTLVSAKQQAKESKKSVKKLKLQIDNLASNKQKTCYYCGQPLNQAEKKREIGKITNEIKINCATYVASEKHYKKLQPSKKNTEALKSLKAKLPNVTQIEKTISKLRSAEKVLENRENDIKLKEHDIKSLAEQYQSLKQTDNKVDYTKKIKLNHNKLNKQVKHITDLGKSLKLYEQTSKVYSNQGIRSMVLDLILPFINKQTNHYLELLTSGSINVMITPVTTSKSTGNSQQRINIKIDNQHGADTYENLSSGEKKRVDLSIILALQDYVLMNANTSMNVISFDEVFDALDESGTVDVMKLINERAKHFPNILVVSHNNQLKSLFSNYIVITKKNGVSTITQR